MNETTDRRVRKTKAALHQALFTLLKNKSLSDITVMELTEAADVNRKTFYNHYNGIHDVLDEVENECVDYLISMIHVTELDAFINEPSLFFRRLISELKDNEEFYVLLIEAKAQSRITQKLMQREKELMRSLIPGDTYNETWGEFFLSFISAGTSAVINHWLMSGRQVSVDSLAEFFGVLFTSADARRFLRAVQINPDNQEHSLR